MQMQKNTEAIFAKMQNAKREPTPLERHNTVPVAVADDSTPERLALANAQKGAEEFLGLDAKNAEVVSAMLAIRRLYVVAYRELLETLENCGKELDPLTAEYLALSVVHKAAQPFDERELFVGVVESLVPWVAEVARKHVEADKQKKEVEVEERRKDHKERKLQLGILTHLESQDTYLDKSVSLVFVGWYKATLYLLDKITASIIGEKGKFDPYCVIRMTESRPSSIVKDLLNFVIVPESEWHGCCNTASGVPRAIASIGSMLTYAPDVLICDDLAKAMPKPGWPRPDAALAGDAHKQLKKFCSGNNMGLVGAIPTVEKTLPDLNGMEFNQIRTFAQVVPLAVEEDGSDYKITINRGGIVLSVPKVEIDSYSGGVVLG